MRYNECVLQKDAKILIWANLQRHF